MTSYFFKSVVLAFSLISLPSFALDSWITVSNHKSEPILFQAYKGSSPGVSYPKFTECFQVPASFSNRVSVDTEQGTLTLNAHSSVPLAVNAECFANKVNLQFSICKATGCVPTHPATTSFLGYEPNLPKEKQIHWYMVDKFTWIEVNRTLVDDYLALSVSPSGK